MKGYDPFTPDAGFDTEPVFDAPPPRPRGANIEGMRKALMRSNTRLLLSAVMLFQFTACLLYTSHFLKHQLRVRQPPVGG